MSRAPKPSAIEIAEGYPGHRKLNAFEPHPPEIEPPMPKSLTAGARRYWKQIVPMLQTMRVLTEPDGLMLGKLCQQLDDQDTIAESIREEGLLIKNPKTGHVHVNPLLKMQMQIAREITVGLREFGMSPASRTRVRMVDSQALDPLEAALCG